MVALSIDVNGVFSRIREQRDRLNATDDELSSVIAQVETALVDLKPGVPAEVTYAGPEGEERILTFAKSDGAWRIHYYGGARSCMTPIGACPRHARAEVFVPLPEGPTPLELLILEVAASIERIIRERQQALERARALSTAVAALGYPRP